MKKLIFQIFVLFGTSELYPGNVAESSELQASEIPPACQRFVSGARDADLMPALIDAASDSPEEPCGLLFRGLLHREQGELPDAIKALESGVMRHPGHLPLLLELAVTLSWNQQVEAALDRYREAIALDPNLVPAVLGEARMLSWLGDLAAAKRIYSDLAATTPGQREALKGLAFVFRAQMKLKAAEALYRTILEKDQEDLEAIEGLAAIAAVERWQVEVRGGSESLSEGAGRDLFGVLVRYQRRSRSFITLALARDGVIFRDPLLGAETVESLTETLRGGFSFSLGPRTTAGFEFESRAKDRADVSTITRLWGAEVSHRLSRSTTFLAGLRLGNDSQNGTSLLGFLGALVVPRKNQEVVVQLFGSEDSMGDLGAAVAGHWQATFAERLRVRVAASFGENAAATFAQGAVNVGYRFGKLVEIGVGYQHYDGRFRQSSVTGEAVFRF